MKNGVSVAANGTVRPVVYQERFLQTMRKIFE